MTILSHSSGNPSPMKEYPPSPQRRIPLPRHWIVQKNDLETFPRKYQETLFKLSPDRGQDISNQTILSRFMLYRSMMGQRVSPAITPSNEVKRPGYALVYIVMPKPWLTLFLT